MLDYRIIGNRIKQQRKQQGKTQSGLAKEVHLSPKYISQLERGARRPSLESLVSISRKLDANIDFFISGTLTDSKEYLQQDIFRKTADFTAKEMLLLYKIINLIKERIPAP